MASTSQVSGLSSGFDWKTMLEKLRQVENNKVVLIQNQQKSYQDKITAWQGINTKLLSLKTAAQTLNQTDQFDLYKTTLSSNTTTAADDILSVNTSTDAAPGTYQIKVTSLASAQKLSSASYGQQTTALNLSGDLVIGGKTVKISASDTLLGIRDKINNANTGTSPSGVTASIVNYGKGGYRVILTSDTEGAGGISLLNGGSTDLVEAMGFADASAKTAKNALTGGNESDSFSAADKAIGGSDLLNLTSAQSGTVSITLNGTTRSVGINLATDSLNAIRDSINTAFGSTVASVLDKTDDSGNTTHRLLIEGSTIAYGDSNNILETLGILKKAGFSDERGMTGDVANNSAGAAITASTLMKDIDGYNDYSSGDTITLSGKNTSGADVNHVFTLTDNTTINDLLTAITAQYGNVTASVTSDGKIRVVDNVIGDANLAVTLAPSKSSVKFDTDNNFGSLSTIRSRQIQAGADANISIDGVTVTPSSNTVTDVIPGVTLNLKKQDPDTTVNLVFGRDYDALKEKISGLVNAYNDAVDAINAQLKYNTDTKQPGGVLFGDGSLRTLKSNLTHIVLGRVSGADPNLSTLALVGVKIGTDNKLTIDEDALKSNLESHFTDVQRLFAAGWSSTNSNLTYSNHTVDTKAGTYSINVTGTNPVAGYFVNPGDATGNGEFLTGSSGDAKGLMVRYSGTATGSVGSLTVTYGAAELLDRSLYYITDSVDGTIVSREKTIQDHINNLDQDIKKMQDRIDSKMQTMENQFIRMESILSTLQSQSSWLTSQINTLK
jgi:flagellar hook-associated protein 2